MQLLNTVEDLPWRLDGRKATDLLILDFSKAFDTVPHRRLLHKFQHYGVTGRTNKWIKSWLCYCQQWAVLDGSDLPVFSGVPQGTVLGPMMFLLYVNDIGAKVSPQTIIKLCGLLPTIQNEIQLQQDLDSMVDWSNTWLMRSNHWVLYCQVTSTQDYQTVEIYTYQIQYQQDPASITFPTWVLN